MKNWLMSLFRKKVTVKEVKFRRDILYFTQDPCGLEEAIIRMHQFMEQYNCKSYSEDFPNILVCSPEDFTVIMLTHPDVVVAVL